MQTSNLSNCNDYPVQIIETDASIRVGLQPIMFYRLVIQLNQMELNDGYKILCRWPFKYVRRYGYTRSSFSFEAGSKCETGEGLFIFRNPMSKTLYNQIIANVSHIKQLRHTDSINVDKFHVKSDTSRQSLHDLGTPNTANALDNTVVPHFELNGSIYAQVDKKWFNKKKIQINKIRNSTNFLYKFHFKHPNFSIKKAWNWNIKTNKQLVHFVQTIQFLLIQYQHLESINWF